MKNKKLIWAGISTLAGTIIGAGILGLPYVFGKSGFFIGLFWLVLLGLIMLITNFYLGEITLRTKKIHQLPGYAEKYLGEKGKYFMFIAVIIGIYSALLAYLIGESQSLSQLFTGGLNHSFYFALGFWALMCFLISKGLRGLKKSESYGVFAIVLIIAYLFITNLNKIKADNLFYFNTNNLFLPFGVILFAYLGFLAVPEVRRILKNNKGLMRKTIFLGLSIPFVLYILFVLVFLGILGKNISEVATLSFGLVVLFLGIFTMFTSYFVLNFALKDIFNFDFKVNKYYKLFFVYLLPFIFYLLVFMFELTSFVDILGLGGALSGGLTGILIMLIVKKAKSNGDRKPEYSLKINWFIIAIISLIFLAGIVYEIWRFFVY